MTAGAIMTAAMAATTIAMTGAITTGVGTTTGAGAAGSMTAGETTAGATTAAMTIVTGATCRPHRYSLDFGYRSGYELAWRDWLSHGRYNRHWRRDAFYGYGVGYTYRSGYEAGWRDAAFYYGRGYRPDYWSHRPARRLVLRFLDFRLRLKTPARLRERRRAGTQGGVCRKEPAWILPSCANG